MVKAYNSYPVVSKIGFYMVWPGTAQSTDQEMGTWKAQKNQSIIICWKMQGLHCFCIRTVCMQSSVTRHKGSRATFEIVKETNATSKKSAFLYCAVPLLIGKSAKSKESWMKMGML